MKARRLLVLALLFILPFGLVRLAQARIARLGSKAISLPPTQVILPSRASSSLVPQADDPSAPGDPVKLIFIHHSCGENWLNDSDGGLGIALRDNNYFASDTNYGWGPPDADLGYENIGDHTDIGHWYNWFVGPHAITYTTALYTEYGQHSSYSRMASDPGGENEIIMFKSCYPNSHLGGNPDDPPTSGSNPLRGRDAYDDSVHTVANAKGIYNDLLDYFATRQDKLFVVITAPPLQSGDTDASHAANARAFNNWLVEDWLDGYAHDNVAVWDFYNVLTSNGGDANTNDLGIETGNHHRWWNGAVQHIQTMSNNYSAHPGGSGGGSHPTTAGNRKATAEFVPLLNVFYDRWKSEATCEGITGVTLTGPTTVYTSTLYTFTAVVTPIAASTPITYTWEPEPDGGQGSASARYTWATTGTQTLTVTAENCGGSDTDSHSLTIQTRHANHHIYLPLALRNHGSVAPSGDLVQPGDFTYLGAFRLPGGDDPPLTFAYGGNAMTFNPDGDPDNSDAYPGSLFITGHDRQAWGTLPDGNQVAEVSIPVPDRALAPAGLPQAAFIQGFQDVVAGYFTNLAEIPKVGLQYLNHPDTGPLIHLCWGQHLQPSNVPSHAWFSANLTTPDLQGVWFIGHQNLYSTNGYLFDIPAAWAGAHAQGRPLATGRMRDGGQGGMGPALFAYRPWLAGGAAPVSGTHLSESVLLLYENAYNTEAITRSLDGYQHPDEWEGGAWITTPSDKSAVLFAGTKSNGAKYWYGYVHPEGPDKPCVDTEVTDFLTCRLADGTACPPADLAGCCDETAGTCISGRGWWATRFDAQFILYDPAGLARVAAGELASWEPQPYAVMDIDPHLYLDPPVWDEVNLGWGQQRRYRIGAAAYDRENGLLYVLELYADRGKPVVHVWRVT